MVKSLRKWLASKLAPEMAEDAKRLALIRLWDGEAWRWLPRSVGGTDAARNAIVPQVAAEIIGAYLETEVVA